MWLFFLIIAIPLTVRYFLSRLGRWLTSRRFQRERLTKPPVKLIKTAPSQGRIYYTESIRAFKERRFLELIKGRHEAGGYTFQSQSLGSHVISTSEPDNIKALPATTLKITPWDFDWPPLAPYLVKASSQLTPKNGKFHEHWFGRILSKHRYRT